MDHRRSKMQNNQKTEVAFASPIFGRNLRSRNRSKSVPSPKSSSSSLTLNWRLSTHPDISPTCLAIDPNTPPFGRPDVTVVFPSLDELLSRLEGEEGTELSDLPELAPMLEEGENGVSEEPSLHSLSVSLFRDHLIPVWYRRSFYSPQCRLFVEFLIKRVLQQDSTVMGQQLVHLNDLVIETLRRPDCRVAPEDLESLPPSEVRFFDSLFDSPDTVQRYASVLKWFHFGLVGLMIDFAVTRPNSSSGFSFRPLIEYPLGHLPLQPPAPRSLDEVGNLTFLTPHRCSGQMDIDSMDFLHHLLTPDSMPWSLRRRQFPPGNSGFSELRILTQAGLESLVEERRKTLRLLRSQLLDQKKLPCARWGVFLSKNPALYVLNQSWMPRRLYHRAFAQLGDFTGPLIRQNDPRFPAKPISFSCPWLQDPDSQAWLLDHFLGPANCRRRDTLNPFPVPEALQSLLQLPVHRKGLPLCLFHTPDHLENWMLRTFPPESGMIEVCLDSLRRDHPEQWQELLIYYAERRAHKKASRLSLTPYVNLLASRLPPVSSNSSSSSTSSNWSGPLSLVHAATWRQFQRSSRKRDTWCLLGTLPFSPLPSCYPSKSVLLGPPPSLSTDYPLMWQPDRVRISLRNLWRLHVMGLNLSRWLVPPDHLLSSFPSLCVPQGLSYEGRYPLILPRHAVDTKIRNARHVSPQNPGADALAHLDQADQGAVTASNVLPVVLTFLQPSYLSRCVRCRRSLTFRLIEDLIRHENQYPDWREVLSPSTCTEGTTHGWFCPRHPISHVYCLGCLLTLAIAAPAHPENPSTLSQIWHFSPIDGQETPPFSWLTSWPLFCPGRVEYHLTTWSPRCSVQRSEQPNLILACDHTLSSSLIQRLLNLWLFTLTGSPYVTLITPDQLNPCVSTTRSSNGFVMIHPVKLDATRLALPLPQQLTHEHASSSSDHQPFFSYTLPSQVDKARLDWRSQLCAHSPQLEQLDLLLDTLQQLDAAHDMSQVLRWRKSPLFVVLMCPLFNVLVPDRRCQRTFLLQYQPTLTRVPLPQEGRNPPARPPDIQLPWWRDWTHCAGPLEDHQCCHPTRATEEVFCVCCSHFSRLLLNADQFPCTQPGLWSETSILDFPDLSFPHSFHLDRWTHDPLAPEPFVFPFDSSSQSGDHSEDSASFHLHVHSAIHHPWRCAVFPLYRAALSRAAFLHFHCPDDPPLMSFWSKLDPESFRERWNWLLEEVSPLLCGHPFTVSLRRAFFLFALLDHWLVWGPIRGCPLCGALCNPIAPGVRHPDVESRVSCLQCQRSWCYFCSRVCVSDSNQKTALSNEYPELATHLAPQWPPSVSQKSTSDNLANHFLEWTLDVDLSPASVPWTPLEAPDHHFCPPRLSAIMPSDWFPSPQSVVLPEPSEKESPFVFAFSHSPVHTFLFEHYRSRFHSFFQTLLTDSVLQFEEIDRQWIVDQISSHFPYVWSFFSPPLF